jgi:hypothetical protein
MFGYQICMSFVYRVILMHILFYLSMCCIYVRQLSIKLSKHYTVGIRVLLENGVNSFQSCYVWTWLRNTEPNKHYVDVLHKLYNHSS